MFADDRKSTLSTLHTDAVNKTVSSQERNAVRNQQLRNVSN